MDTKDSFEKIYGEYAKAIYRFAYIKTNSKELAEDLTADTFCKYFEYSKKESAIQNARAVLYQIVRNLIIDTYRRRAFREAKIVQGVDMESIASEESILSSLVLQETYKEVKEAMGHIKKEYEDILLLHYIEDMSTSEIAIIQETNENNVRVKLHRATKALKNHLSGTSS